MIDGHREHFHLSAYRSGVISPPQEVQIEFQIFVKSQLIIKALEEFVNYGGH